MVFENAQDNFKVEIDKDGFLFLLVFYLLNLPSVFKYSLFNPFTAAKSYRSPSYRLLYRSQLKRVVSWS